MAEKRVQTVLGARDAGSLGITDAHTHVWITDVGVRETAAPVIDDPEFVEAELRAYQQAGGGALLDCQPGECGRNGNQLRELSRNTGVIILACTGFHLREYYPDSAVIWQLDSDQALDHFLAEIRLGLQETWRSEPVYPGFVKVAVRDNLQNTPLGLLEAAGQASLESGLLIEMHTQRGQGAESFLNWFQQRGFPLHRLAVCHIDKRPDPGLHQELAQAGCLLEYDTFFRPKYKPDENLWPLLFKMVEDGYEDAIACATDLAERSLWRMEQGGPGLPGLIDQIKTRLDEHLKDTEVVRKLVGGNIASRLAN